LDAIVEWPFLFWAPHHPVLAVVAIVVMLAIVLGGWRVFYGYPWKKK
jgi:hypothetical protein